MKDKVIQNIDYILGIQNPTEQIQTAIDKFSSKEYSAKVIRALYERLILDYRKILVDGIYGLQNPNSKENMERCPPNMLMTDEPYPYNKGNIFYSSKLKELYLLLGTYELMYKFSKSKVQNKAQRYEKVIGEFRKEFFERLGYCESNYNLSELARSCIDLFHEKMLEHKKYDTSILRLPSNITFGVELEFVGVPIDFIRASNHIKAFLKKLGWDAKYDGSVKEIKVGKNGREKTVFRFRSCISNFTK